MTFLQHKNSAMSNEQILERILIFSKQGVLQQVTSDFLQRFNENFTISNE